LKTDWKTYQVLKTDWKPFSDNYFTTVVHYIHANPQLHRICDDYREYPHSSYLRLLIDKPSRLKKQELFEKFGGKAVFIKFHESQWNDLKNKDKYEIED
jgi:hypothetical protein